MIAYSLIIVLWVAAFIAALIGSPVEGVQSAALSVGAGIALAGAGSLLGGLASDYINAKQQADTNEANKEIAEKNRQWQSEENRKSRQWSQDMWNMNNAYNTPSAMAQRQREAGFNPYLVDSSGLGTGVSQTPTANTSSSAPQAPEMVAPRIGATANALNQLPSMVAQAYSAESQISATNANAANQRADAESRIIENSQNLYKTFGREASENYFNRSMQSLRGAKIEGGLFARDVEASVKIRENNARLTEVQADLEKEFGRKRAQTALDQIDQSIAESGARIGMMSSNAKVNDSTIKKNASDIALNVVKAWNLKKQGELYVATAAQYNAIRESLSTIMQNKALESGYHQQEAAAQFAYGENVRGYKTNDAAKNVALDNWKLLEDNSLNELDRLVKIVSPFTPSTNFSYGYQEKDFNWNVNQ